MNGNVPGQDMGSLLSAKKLSPEEFLELQKKAEAERVLRNKMWHELTVEEKVERMRGQVKYHLSELERSNFQLRKKVEKLMKHSHLPSGQIVSLLEPYGDEMVNDRFDRNNEWF